MPDNILQLNTELIHSELKDLVKNSVEETLNALLDAKADRLVNAERYARDEERQGYRAGHYDRSFTTTSGEVNLRMPKLKGVAFETAIIERYRRRETSVEEALIEMYLAGVSVLIAIGVTEDGYREILGAAEGLKEDLESWKNFFVWLKSRGLSGVKLIIGDKALGMVESIGQVFPEAKYQRCTVHFYRNALSSVPNRNAAAVAKMLKAIHAQEDKEAAREKAKRVVEKLKAMKLGKAAKAIETGFEETLTFMSFPSKHWLRIRTNNALKRLNREIKRQTKVVGTFPDGESALMLVCAKLRHVASSEWGSKRYLNMEHLKSMILSEEEGLIAG